MSSGAETTLTFVLSLLFAVVHLFAGKLRFLEGIPRSRWLSAAGGVSVAYVFVHMLPELAEHQERFAEAVSGDVLSDLGVYLVALVGLACFYGLERAAVTSRRAGKGSGEGTPPGVFWIHLGSFALYNLVIAYLLLHREEDTATSLWTYFVAMAFHFVVNDYGLREHHKHQYESPGRWILAAAVVMGWALGAATDLPEEGVTALFAFLAGGVIMNVLKEELPEERMSRFSAFALGCAAYAALLLAAA